MKRRLFALVLALCVFAGVCFPAPVASAASSAVYVTANTLKVYKSASASSKCLGVMAYGESMTSVAVSGSWVKVRNSAGATGYCEATGLSSTNPNTMNVTAKVNTANAPLYKRPDTGTKVWVKLKKGASFTAVAMTRDNLWVRLKNGKYYGYIQAKYLTTADSPAPTATPAPSGLSGTVYVSVTALKVYAKASTSAKVKGTMYYGQSMNCVAVNGSWATVKNGSATGYCQVGGLSAADPNTLSKTVYVNTDNAPIYKIPVSGAAVWTKLKKNSSYTAVAVTPDGTWTRIRNGKYFAYILSKYLSAAATTAAPTATATPAPPATATPSPVSGTVYVIAGTLPLRKEASASGKLVSTLGYGESVSLIAQQGEWVQVRSAAGTAGYCARASLSPDNPNTLSRKVTVTVASAPIYKLPDANTAVWTKLKKNSSYTAVAVTPDGKWARIQNGKYFAYIRTDSITSPTATATPAPTATPKPTATPAPTAVYVAGNMLKIYKSASNTAGLLSTLGYGDALTLISTAGAWAQVRLSTGKTGYCEASALTTKNPNSYNQTVYIASNNAPLYKLPQSGLAVWAKLKKNDSYTAVAITADGSWFRLKNGNYYGYIESKYVSAMKDEGNQTVYVTATTLSVYADASTSAKGLGSMYFGQSMTLIGSADGWAKVRNASGATGYCLLSGLTTKNINTLNKPYYAKNKSVKLYAKPSTGATAVQTVSQNASLMAVCISEDSAWARVALSDGSFAYVQMSDLSDKKIDDGTLLAEIEPVTVYVVPTSLTIYASTSTSAKALGTMYFGQSMRCTGKSSTWARVVNDAGAVGYCDVNSVTTKNPNTYSTPLYAQASGAKVYAKASTSASILGTLSLNAVVTGVCYNSDRSWYRVKSGDSYGYVQAAFFATSPMADSGQSGKIGAIISLAKTYLGVPYVYGGQSPKGFDCSGFVYYVFKNAAGVTLKRTAYTQGYDDKYPKITNMVDLKVGDVLFFNTVTDDDDKCDHAAIYLGNNQFIHASSGGGKVMISSLGTNDKSYYFRTYSWARRIIQ